MTTSLDVISGEQLCTPILHEDCSFGYMDQRGDIVGAIGYADYFEDFTIITHTGGRSVLHDLLTLDIPRLRFGGEMVRVRRIAPTEGGLPRFKIDDRGYDYYYPKDDAPEIEGEIGGIDAWSALHPADRQMHLGECETLRDGAPKISDLHAAYSRGL